MNELIKLLLTAIDASLQAGKLIMDVYKSDDYQVNYKSDNSPLTIADKNAHLKIVEILNDTQLPILSEEGATIPYETRRNWEYFWLVDPLDGTKEFIKRNGQFTVNIALIHKTQAVMGIIYAPVKKELYYGAENIGAYKLTEVDSNFDLRLLTKKSMKLPLTAKRDKVIIIGSRSHMTGSTKEVVDKYLLKYKNSELITGGSSLKLCMIAEGTADVYPRFAPTMEWDTAAGQAIIEAAGGSLLKADSKMPGRLLEPMDYNRKNLENTAFVARLSNRFTIE